MAAAIVGWRQGQHTKRCSKYKRHAGFYDSREHLEGQARRLLKVYDTDKSGVLSMEELAKLLTDRDYTKPKGTLPTEDEMQYVLWFADLNNDSCIDQKELELALQAWESYTAGVRQRMRQKLIAFDASGSGSLELHELKVYLTHLNLGRFVADEDAEDIFRAADINGDGVIHTAELALATHIWRVHCDMRRKSQVCTVM